MVEGVEIMVVQLWERSRRVGASVVVIAAAAAMCVACSSSGGGHPAGNSSTSGGSTTSAAAGSSTSAAGESTDTAGTVVDPFCAGYTPLALSGLSSTSNFNDLVNAWDKYAASAPSAIKNQVQDVDKYLRDYQNKDYSSLTNEAQSIGDDVEEIGAYIATHCHT